MSDAAIVTVTDSAPTTGPAPRIEYVREGHYLQPDGTRVWKEHSRSDTLNPAFDPHLGIDRTGRKVHQPSEWRIVERDLNQLYSVQGLYPRRGGRGREWQDHTTRVDLATARFVYRWFHRLCQDPERDFPNQARVINMDTGEIVPMDGFVEPMRRPGDAIRTIPVTAEEWAATRSCFHNWETPLRRAPRRKGGFVWTNGREVVGYEDADGAVRIRPSAYQSPRTSEDARAA